MLHQGTAVQEKSILFKAKDITHNTPKLEYSRIIFVEPPYGVHCNFLEGALILKLDTFCNDILESAEDWLKEYESKKEYKENSKKFMQRYPTGLAPHLVGIPVIS